TFSNAKNREQVLDIQRDHQVLIDASMRLLDKNGTLYFSSNFRKFKLDKALVERYDIENITKSTLDPDFSRQVPIHHCWKITHKQDKQS
ncbi:MAG: 23S rRNA (guanine(2445)-N(2))/(guanine(2069)-N(7))-methyltransferase, partial [Pseudomonadales bacterium]|nr:23S rRNA (guanine(2445)-N(2))/(guanine(2069)-N(7))-methyltransferase [Pseudomonadales bacterium]